MSPDVADDDVLRTEHLAKIRDDSLRFHRKRLIGAVLGELIDDRLSERLGQEFLFGRRRVRQRGQGLLDATDHADFQHVVFIHLGRHRVDVDDFAVFVFVPEVGVVFDHVVPDTDDHIRTIKSAGHVVVGLKSHRTQAVRMRGRHRALGHERGSHGHVELLGESDQLSTGVMTDDTITGHDDRITCGRNDLRRLVDLALRRRWGASALHFQRALFRFHPGYVFGKLYETYAGFLRFRLFECFANHFGNDLGCEDRRAVLRDRFK